MRRVNAQHFAVSRRKRRLPVRGNPCCWRGLAARATGFQSFVPTTREKVTFPLQSRCRAHACDGSGRNLKHDALVLASACVSCAKDISIFIHGYAAIRLRALAATDEVVKVGKGPAALSRN